MEKSPGQVDAVIDHVGVGVMVADDRGRIVKLNPAALRLLGLVTSRERPARLEELEKRCPRFSLDQSLLPRAAWPEVRALRGETVDQVELRIQPEGTGRPVMVRCSASLIPGGEEGARLVVVTLTDVTDRSEAQSALREAQAGLKDYADKLEDKVAERTAALREAVTQMEEFSFTVSHDLRAPLRSIKGYAEILLGDYGSKLKGDGLGYLERIVENGARMERLVNDVLTISRLSKTKVKLGRVSTQAILESLVGEYANLLGAPRIVLEPLPPILGHDSLCTQIFSNLLGNAAKFVRPGVAPQIRIWSERAGEFVRIHVQDNGIGISPEYHQKIFGMFERLDAENRYGGTGIGLAIVRRAAEKMNGRAGVESDGHTGSRFWVELPAWTGEK